MRGPLADRRAGRWPVEFERVFRSRCVAPAVAQRLSRIGWITRVNDSAVPCGNPATNSSSWRGKAPSWSKPGGSAEGLRPREPRQAGVRRGLLEGARGVETPSDLEFVFRLLIESVMLVPLASLAWSWA